MLHPLRVAALTTAVLSLACTTSAPEAPAAAKARPLATCASTHVAEGPACVPKLETCADGATPRLGGGCLTIGVPKDGCAPGFTHDGKGGCAPVLPAATCAPGTWTVPGETTCGEVAPCAVPADAAGTLWVSAAATSKGDGTRARPYQTLGEAIAAAASGATVAVLEGRYVEDVVVDKPLRVVGQCPAKVSIVGASADVALDVRAKATIERVAVTGPKGAVGVTGNDVVLDRLWIHGSGLEGVWLHARATNLVLRHSLVEDLPKYGVIGSGGKVTVEQTRVRGVREEGAGAGIQVNPSLDGWFPAELVVTGSLVEGNAYQGVRVISSTATIDGTVLRDNLPALDGDLGAGLIVGYHLPSKLRPKATVRRSFIAGNTHAGVLLQQGDLIVESTVVRDQKVRPKGDDYGRGLVVQGYGGIDATVLVRDSLIDANQETGIDLNGKASGTIERTWVRDTRVNAKAKTSNGTGVFAEIFEGDAPSLVVTDSVLSGHPNAGMIATGALDLSGSRLTKNGSLGLAVRGGNAKIAATHIHANTGAGGDGHGIYAPRDAARVLAPQVEIEDSLVEDVQKVGIALFDGALRARRIAVRRIAADPDGNAGIGIVVDHQTPQAEPTIELSSVLIESTAAASLFVAGATGELSGVYARGSKGLGGADGYGDGLVAAGKAYGPTRVIPSDLVVRGSIFENHARAGLALFAANVHLFDSFLACNAFDVNTERTAGFYEGSAAEADYSLEADDSNVCGCGAVAVCRAVSSGLKPAPGVD